jgi:iron(III) transport system substrate-binding protein
VEEAGLLEKLPQATLDAVDADYRDPAGTWVGVSGRARVVAYSTERVKASELPSSIFDFTDPRWKGRIGFPPPNASFQAFISGMRLAVGDERTKQWLEDIKKNEPALLENNIQTEEAIAAGEIDVGFVNHYYVFELRAERPDFPVANHFLEDGDPGTLVNVSGVGILKSTDREGPAQQLVDYLLSEQGQRYFPAETSEYPLVDGVAPPEGARPLELHTEVGLTRCAGRRRGAARPWPWRPPASSSPRSPPCRWPTSSSAPPARSPARGTSSCAPRRSP